MQNTALAISAVFCMILLTACLPETPSPTPILPTPTVTITPTPTATIVWFPPTATPTPIATQEVMPTEDPRPALGALILQDPFTDQSQWGTGKTGAGSVGFGKNELTLAVSTPQGNLISLREAPQLSNFYMEIDALPSLCLGNDLFGLLLRANSSQDYYRLMINCKGQVRMERVIKARMSLMQDWMGSGQLQPGGMMRTKVGVWANGQDLHIFINGVYHFSVKDSVYPSGVVGVFARSAGDTPLTVSFSNLSVYAASSSAPNFLPTLTPPPVLK